MTIRKPHSCCSLIVASLCLSWTVQVPPIADSTEIFRLTKGLHCTYVYQRHYDYSYYGRSSSRDSGTVEYLVLDSTRAGDASITWSILETRNTSCWFQDESGETSFVIMDSVIFDMSESTVGDHEYQGHSRVWNFPATNRSYDTLHVNRFADTSAVTLGNQYQCLYVLVPSFDSLWIRDDSGLVRRQWFICEDLDDMFGTTESGDARLIARTITLVGAGDRIPSRLALRQNYPNPFNPVTTIDYILPKASYARMHVFDVLGRPVATLVDAFMNPGSWSVRFDGSQLPSGVYFYRLAAGGYVDVKKMMLVK